MSGNAHRPRLEPKPGRLPRMVACVRLSRLVFGSVRDAEAREDSRTTVRPRAHRCGASLPRLRARRMICSVSMLWRYLQGIDNAEIIETVHARRAPMVPVSASLRL